MLRGVGERWKKGGGSAALISILKDQGNRTAFKLLVRTTSAMFGLPLLVFFLAHSFVLDQLFTFKSPGDKGLWSGARCTQPRAQNASLLAPSRHVLAVARAGVCALCTVQIVIIGFLVAAFNEPPEPIEDAAAQKKKDK